MKKVLTYLGLTVALSTAGPALAAQVSIAGEVCPDSVGATVNRLEVFPYLHAFHSGHQRLTRGAEPKPTVLAASDESGRFHLEAPTIGVWKLRAEAPGHVPMVLEPLPLVDPTEAPPVTPLPASEAKLWLQRADGTPLADTWIYARTASPGVWKEVGADGWEPAVRIERTDSEGRVTFLRAEDEKLRISAFPDGTLGHTWAPTIGGTLTLPAREEIHRIFEVRDPRGEPLEGILVRAGPLAWPVGLTDARGHLKLDTGRETELELWLFAPDGRRQALTVELPAETSSELIPLVFEDPLRVAGRVLDAASGGPMAGALVWPGYEPALAVTTDARGRFELPAPGDRPFWLQVEAAGHLSQAMRITHDHLASGRAPTLALSLAAAAVGRVVDVQGQPLVGVRVEALRTSARRRAFRPDGADARSTSDAEGRFRLAGLDPETGYTVRAHLSGFSPARVDLAGLTPSRIRSGLLVTLRLTRRAHGRVLDLEERPLAGAEVTLRPAGEARQSQREDDTLQTVTGEQGHFELPDLPAPRVELSVTKSGFAPLTLPGIDIPPGEGPVDLGTILLEPGAAVRGVVTDASGDPLEGAAVYRVPELRRAMLVQAFRRPRRPPDAVTGTEGRFTLKDLRPGDRIDLVIHRDGFLPAAARGLEAPSPQPLTVVLEPAAAIRGVVVDEEGQPIAGAGVELDWQGREGDPEGDLWFTVGSLGSATSDRMGRFFLESLAPGRAEISVSAAGYQPSEAVEVELPAGQVVEGLSVVLKTGAVLAGRVLTEAGEPVAEARVRAHGGAASSDAEGVFRITGLVPGPDTVDAHHPEYGRVEKELVIEPGSNTLDLIFPPGYEVTGHVVDGDDRPVVGAWVELEDETGGWRRVRAASSEEGAFRLVPVTDGRYALRAQAPGYASVQRPGAVEVAGAPVHDLEVRLFSGATLTGTIRGLDLAELIAVEVQAEAEGDVALQGRVRHDGSYVLEHLPPGDWLVAASLAGGSRRATARVSVRPEDREVHRDLEFDSALTLTGQVIYGGEPLPGADVGLRGSDVAARRSVGTDHEGRFEIRDLEPGRYRLQVSSGRHGFTHDQILDLQADQDRIVEIATARVAGRVTEAGGSTPIPDAMILLRRVAGDGVPAGASDAAFLVGVPTEADGSFRIPRVTAGRYTLTARKDSYAAAEEMLDVEPGGDLENLRLELEPTSGLTLDVRLASGSRPRFVSLSVLDTSGREVTYQSRGLNDDGLARFPTLSAGSWTLLVSAPDGATTETTATVPGDPVRLTLPPSSRLRVRVPELVTSVSVAVLTLTGPDGRIFRGNTSEAGNRRQWPVEGGRATVPSLPPGLWALHVVAPDGASWSGSVMVEAGVSAAVTCTAGHCTLGTETATVE